MKLFRIGRLIVPILLLQMGSVAYAVQLHFIDFEGFSDLTAITNQYAAQQVTFSNATVLTAGLSLNEFELPPHSGQNIVFDNGGAMRIDFGVTAYEWSAYFTYVAPITITAYDEFNNVSGIITSTHSENVTSSGNDPNDLYGFNLVSGFRSITIEGFATGGTFAMDDMSFATADATDPVPEPGTFMLLASGLATSGFVLRKRAFRNRSRKTPDQPQA